jgi:hypothetical protein
MRGSTRSRRIVAAATAAVLMSSGAAVALAGPASADPPNFFKTIIDTVDGVAFTTIGDVVGDSRDELVVTSYGAYEVVGGVAQLNPGTVTIYTNTDPKRNSGIENWAKIPVVTEADNIIFPSQPTLSDVDGDGDTDILQPGGFFWDSNVGLSRGSLTWWENRETPRSIAELAAHARCWLTSKTWADLAACITAQQSFKRNNIDVDSPFSYHNLQHVDFDGDNKKDVIAVGEQGFEAAVLTDDVVELQFYKGLGKGKFAPKVVLANRGGSNPVVDDVDGDGDLDIISAQYFGVSPVVLGAPTGEASFVWFERTGSAAGGIDASDFTMHEISRGQGPSFGVYKAKNLYGDGVDRWVGVNHTNKTVGNPGPPVFLRAAPNVFLMTPGADIKTPWALTPLASAIEDGAAFAVNARPGQAAPGKVGFGDLDGDGDTDLTVSGDGDFRLFWFEQTAPGAFTQRVLPGSEGWGQAGGSQIVDLNKDGINEVVFSSFENDQLGIWSRS